MLLSPGLLRWSVALIPSAEEAQCADKLIGLAGQLLCSRSHLFGSGGVLLDHLLKLLKRLVDLLGASILLPACGCDLLNQFSGSLDIGHELVEHLARFLRYLDRRP